jgi:ketosteroid isomerase-like protein
LVNRKAGYVCPDTELPVAGIKYHHQAMTKEEKEITEIVDRETKAWDTQDVNLLISVFHPDMVWPWPPTDLSHDPENWIMPMGRYNRERWCREWQELFDTHRLLHNIRNIRKIVVSKEKDGAFAVVDIDTIWLDSQNRENHWKGRVCKVYSRVGNEWKMTMHTGVLKY